MTYDEAYSAWSKATDEVKARHQALESLDVIRKVTKESMLAWHDECIRIYEVMVAIKRSEL